MTLISAIEADIARRCGQYLTLNASGTSAGSVIPASTISSTLGLSDPWKGVGYVLRRGLLAAGTAVPGFNTADRTRRVDTFDQSAGTITVDRPYAVAVANTEVLELMALQPDLELRVATIAGLRRCYVTDRVSITTTSFNAERDLTALVSWIQDPSQVNDVGWQYSSSIYPPIPVRAWFAFNIGASVWLRVGADVFPNNLLITARRSADTLATRSGVVIAAPFLDTDDVPFPLDYCAAAGTVEAWRRFPSTLAPGAKIGLIPTLAEAAAEMTRQSTIYYQAPPSRVMLPSLTASVL